MTDITTPVLGESVAEATVARWTKKSGELVTKDEVLVELETDKVSLEVSAPETGLLAEILAPQGATVVPGQKLGTITAQSGKQDGKVPAKSVEAKPDVAPAAVSDGKVQASDPVKALPETAALAPSVRRIAAENHLDPANITGTGRDGRLTKGDALEALARPPAPVPSLVSSETREKRVPMTRLRQTIARRLKDAQNTAAMLTTFNEVDMSAVMELRNSYKDVFEKRHGVKLGFMSFFVKACIAALKTVPTVNAEIDGQNLVYKNYYDIGVAVGTEKGLVVPVVRDADRLGFAEIEKTIAALGKQARDNSLSLDQLQGGTFTISNGGIYGSLMSTPILNAPQSGILGMHKIQERPIVVEGQIVVRPMMYLALSYDHRVIDGKEAVTFLVAVKDHIEDPRRLILEV